jgi:hypothetical protein
MAVLVVVVVGTAVSVGVGVGILMISMLSLVQWFQVRGCGELGLLLILRVSDIFNCVHVCDEKRAWVNTCAGVLGADAMEEWGEG